MELTLVVVARVFYPRPQDLSAGPAQVTTTGLPRVFWLYLTGAALVAAGFADFPVNCSKTSGYPPANLYPRPRMVVMRRGVEGSSSILERSRLTWTSRVLVSPT